MSADLFAAFGNGTNDAPDEITHSSPSSTYYPRPQPFHTQEISLIQKPALQVLNQGKALWQKDPSGAEVLFDASDDAEQGDDGFGEFENAKDVAEANFRPVETAEQTDLVGLEEIQGSPNSWKTSVIKTPTVCQTSSKNIKQADIELPNKQPISDSDDEWGDFEDVPTGAVNNVQVRAETTQPKRRTAQQQPPLSSKSLVEIDTSIRNKEDEDDAWDLFEDGKPIEQALQPAKAKPPALPINERPIATQPQQRQADQLERPTNVPPPTILLQLLPQIYNKLSQTPSYDGNTLTVLAQDIVQTYNVSARIISGRTLRWKRDTHLSQSMRIGAAGRSGGMKLTTLDKGESRKEDTEAAETVASWTRNAHLLNAIMARAKTTKPAGNLTISMPVRTANGPDVLTAPLVCPVCGLKRNERVAGIDGGVIDAFGEFWVEHWGHADCCRFWYKNVGLLSSRR